MKEGGLGRLLSCFVQRKSSRCVRKVGTKPSVRLRCVEAGSAKEICSYRRRVQTEFFESKPEKGESPQQLIVRLKDYFLRWVKLSKVDQTFDGIKELLVKERYLATCPKTLELFLRERAVTSLEELGKIAEQYEDAHGGMDGSRKERKHSPLRKSTEINQPGSKSSGSPKLDKPRCFVCNKVGHKAKDCFQRAKVGAMEQVGPRGNKWNGSSNRGCGQGCYQPVQDPRQSQSTREVAGPAIYCRSVVQMS